MPASPPEKVEVGLRMILDHEPGLPRQGSPLQTSSCQTTARLLHGTLKTTTRA